MSSAMERLHQAVIEKTRAEAEKIIREAEIRAREIVEEARRRKMQEIEEMRKRIRDEIQYDVRIAEAKIRARHIIAQAKNDVFNHLRERILRELSSLSPELRRESIKNILREVLSSGVFSDQKLRIYVARQDLNITREVVEELGIGDKVIEILPLDSIIGGVIVQSIDGSIRIDASYERRLELVLSKRAARLNLELFG
ncbi:MAG TPA: hypothetical protein EYH02_01090 [Ignisphaera aggregans]|uniref:V-ATPase subunit E n=1 Tax=Ignisphaera aggregans TaxID=334771 RepID=A0A832YYV7_9CREN|nr:hypothetical protein [Ignisphaera aggregans]